MPTLRLNKIIVILCLTVTVGRFTLDSYFPSLPSIAHFFDSTTSNTQLTLTLYLLGFGMSQFIYGPLSDRFGRRKVMLSGFLIFILSGVLCTFSNSLAFLIFSRLLGGIGAGAGSTLSRAIVSDTYEGINIAKAWAYITTSLMLSLMIAPVIGGYIQDLLGWRYNFFISTLYATLIFLILFLFLPETNLKLNDNALKIKTMIHNYLNLLTHAQFIGYILCSTLAFSGLVIYFQLSPFIFINKIGLSPLTYGWLSLFIANSYLVGGLIVNNFTEKLGMHRMLLIGMSLLICGGIIMLLCASAGYLNITTILGPSIICVIGSRIIIPNAMAGSLSYFKHIAGYASALSGGIQMMGSAFISYIVAQFHQETQLLLALVFIVNGAISIIILNLLVIKNVFHATEKRNNR